MDIVDIYGHLLNGSEIVLGVGNYNNVHGLLTYFPVEDLLQMRSLPEVVTPSVLQLILVYEKPSSAPDIERTYFSLAVKGTNKYLNVKIELDGDRKVACACISPEKAYFWVDYSSIDRIPRALLFAGALYSLQTTFGEQNYVVSWKIQGFSNGDLVLLLPTTWYELTENFCQNNTGVINLVESLNRLEFKGYTTQQWCEDTPRIIHCSEGKQCGDCLGPCQNINHICYANPDPHGTHFICGYPTTEPKMNQSTLVSFADSTPPSSGTAATWLALIIIFIVVGLLTWGLIYRSQTT